MSTSNRISFVINPRARLGELERTPTSAFDEAAARAVLAFHRSVPGYEPTPLTALPALARELGIANLWVKDESPRFGLKAFKVLGASYAAARTLAVACGLEPEGVAFDVFRFPDVQSSLAEKTLVTATDGNHGRAVAWVAEQLGCRAVVYMPKESAQARVNAIKSHGAEVEVIDGNYDDAVARAAADADANAWTLIQDTAWAGYEEIPQAIMQGYLTILSEALDQMGGNVPTHVFVQCGVGSLPGAVLGQLNERFADGRPVVAVVEPLSAACCYLSMAVGKDEPQRVTGDLETKMAGLACGTLSSLAWPILRDYADVSIACGDGLAVEGMRLLANPRGKSQRIVSGESGAVTTGLLAAILAKGDAEQRAGLAAALRIDGGSRVLLISTEGDTDPDSYQRLVGPSK